MPKIFSQHWVQVMACCIKHKAITWTNVDIIYEVRWHSLEGNLQELLLIKNITIEVKVIT